MPKSQAVPLLTAVPEQGAPKEVLAKRTRRSFSAAEKLRIVRAVGAAPKGEIGAILRREGVYNSHVSAWRKALNVRGEEGMSRTKRGRKLVHDPKDQQIAALEKKNAQLQKRLELASQLLELQKKASELLGLSLPESDEKP